MGSTTNSLLILSMMVANVQIHGMDSESGVSEKGLGLIQKGFETQQHQDALAGEDCIHKVLTGIDNLFGICGAYSDIVTCSRKKHTAAACKKQVGPGGNLITQDITEDVTLGKGTSEATRQWHKAFQACTEGHDCSHAVNLHKPVLNSVQRGLTALVSSSSCHAKSQFTGLPALSFTQDDYGDCTTSGQPAATMGLMNIAGEVLRNLPKNALRHFPAKDINTWDQAQLQNADSDQDIDVA